MMDDSLINQDPEAVEATQELLDYTNWLFSQDPKFILSVAQLDQLPPADTLEIAFAGRSNVGKSSLLNALVRKHNLARTSNTPGRTQMLNFFSLSERLLFVDLPGYGYAEAPLKIIANWNKTLRQYLMGRPSLRRVFLLIDARHGIKEKDLEMMTMLDEVAVNYQLVLTKIDKISQTELTAIEEKTRKIAEKHTACHPELLITSSEKKIGIDQVQQTIAALILDDLKR